MFTMKWRSRSITLIILALILILGLFLRFYQLDSQPYWMDEGYTINAIQSGLANGFHQGASILNSGASYFCPLYCYPSAQLSEIIGANAWAYRSLSALFGFLFILLAYFLAKSLFKNTTVALVASALIATSYWQIAWSRQARWYTLLELTFWLALYLFYKFLHAKTTSQQIIYLATASLSTILAIATHRLAYLLPLIMLAWYLLIKKPQFKKIIIAGLSTLAILAFAELALGLHFISNAWHNINFNYNLPYYLSFYLREYWLLIIISIYGYYSANDDDQKKLTLIALPLLVYLLTLSTLTDIVHYRYLFHTNLALYLIASLALVNILKNISKRYLQISLALIFALFYIFSGTGILKPQAFYNLESDDPSQLSRPYYAYTPQPDWNQAYDFIKTNLPSDEIIISSHPHFNKIFLGQPGYWIRYNYLGMEDTVTQITNNKEYYVGAEVINNLEELKTLTSTQHGLIIFDYMAIDNKIDPNIVNYIQTNFKLTYYKELNSYSKIWIYQF